MIVVTRLNDSVFGVNPDLIERTEETPDTVLTLVDGSKFIIKESVHEVTTKIIDFRARVIAGAQAYAETYRPPLTVVDTTAASQDEAIVTLDGDADNTETADRDAVVQQMTPPTEGDRLGS